MDAISGGERWGVWFAANLLPGFDARDFPTTVVTAGLVAVVSAVVTNALHGEPGV